MGMEREDKRRLCLGREMVPWGPELSGGSLEAVGSQWRVLAVEQLWRKAGRVEARGGDHWEGLGSVLMQMWERLRGA